MRKVEPGRKRPDASSLAASRRFSRYKHEEKASVREAGLRENAGIRNIKKAWVTMGTRLAVANEDNYERALSLISRIEYDPKDIELFCLILSQFMDEPGFTKKAGIFISALVNMKDKPECTLHIEHLERLDNLGYKNKGRLVVKGDVDWCAGEMEGGLLDIHGNTHGFLGLGMKGGKIKIQGDAFQRLGDKMKGGSIIIAGNAHNYVGMEMEGGSILIKGNANNLVGGFMTGGRIMIMGDTKGALGTKMAGGEIHVMGHMEMIDLTYGGSNLEWIIHGKVYHKGKLIVDK